MTENVGTKTKITKESKYSSLGLRIKERLKAKRMHIRGLADVTGISLPSINNILYGYTENPSVHSIKQIADTLGCTVDELLGGTKTEIADTSTLDSMKNTSLSSNHKIALIKEIQAFIKQFCEKKQLTLTEEQRREASIEIMNESLTNLSPKGKPVLDKIFAEMVLSVY